VKSGTTLANIPFEPVMSIVTEENCRVWGSIEDGVTSTLRNLEEMALF
jgi:hypothetical protein